VTDEEASQTDTAEKKNLNENRKTESGIIIFNDCDSTVGELRNPEDIGVAEDEHAPCKICYISTHEIPRRLTYLIH
jgi:hypothetical protein